MSTPIVDIMEIMPNGQVAIPKEVLGRLGVAEGSHVAIICKDKHAIVMNANIHAMKTLQRAMRGEAERLGLTTEEDIIRLCREIRAEVEGL